MKAYFILLFMFLTTLTNAQDSCKPTLKTGSYVMRSLPGCVMRVFSSEPGKSIDITWEKFGEKYIEINKISPPSYWCSYGGETHFPYENGLYFYGTNNVGHAEIITLTTDTFRMGSVDVFYRVGEVGFGLE